MNSSDWDHDKLLKLIDLYKNKPELWDSNNKFYHCKNKKHESWLEITEHFDVDVEVIKKKMNSLLSSFRREKARGLKVNELGQGEAYESSWFAFASLAFLLDKSRTNRALPESSVFLESVETEMVDEGSSDGDFMHMNIRQADDIPFPPNAFNEAHPYIVAMNEHFIGPRLKRSRVNRRKKSWENPRNIEHSSKNKNNDSDAFGEYLGMKLKTYSKRTSSIVQHLISNILFEADMGKYDADDRTDDFYYHSVPCASYDTHGSSNPVIKQSSSPRESPTQSPSLVNLKIDLDETSMT